jgi:hypothetical protein
MAGVARPGRWCVGRRLARWTPGSRKRKCSLIDQACTALPRGRRALTARWWTSSENPSRNWPTVPGRPARGAAPAARGRQVAVRPRGDGRHRDSSAIWPIAAAGVAAGRFGNGHGCRDQRRASGAARPRSGSHNGRLHTLAARQPRRDAIVSLVQRLSRPSAPAWAGGRDRRYGHTRLAAIGAATGPWACPDTGWLRGAGGNRPLSRGLTF